MVIQIEWVSVESSLPVENQQILWWGKSTRSSDWQGGGSGTYRRGQFQEDEFGDDLLTIREIRVLEWMPFPEHK